MVGCKSSRPVMWLVVLHGLFNLVFPDTTDGRVDFYTYNHGLLHTISLYLIAFDIIFLVGEITAGTISWCANIYRWFQPPTLTNARFIIRVRMAQHVTARWLATFAAVRHNLWERTVMTVGSICPCLSDWIASGDLCMHVLLLFIVLVNNNCGHNIVFLPKPVNFQWRNRIESTINISFVVIADVNECTAYNNPCQGGGTCINTLGGYTCTCSSGYTGNNCEIGQTFANMAKRAPLLHYKRV